MFTQEELDLAYLSGVFDGEGTINVTRVKNYKNSINTKIAVYNTNENILSLYPKYFGGNIYSIMDKRGVSSSTIFCCRRNYE